MKTKKKSTGNASQWALKECENCRNQIRREWKYKGHFYCYNCYMKKCKRIYFGRPPMGLKDALDIVREIKCSSSKSPVGYLYLPKILIGKKVKLILVD